MPTETIARKYRILREIARSNDVVYEALDSAMGRRLAIKELLLPPNLTGSARAERIERFNREARAAGKLSHHNIVTVYDFGEDAGRYFIAMEYLEGGTLRDLLQARGQLAPQEAADIAAQILAALGHAHANRVVHRDVKPDNIHILPDGLIKLTDFGIARLTEEASLTGDGQVFGTPSYMSPEQIAGRFVDHRTDLFSLGVVLYEMLAGRKPFTGDSVVSITYAIMNAEPAPLVGVPYPLERLVSRALSKDPAMRWQSAEEMRTALKEAMSVPAMLVTTTSPPIGQSAPPLAATQYTPWRAQPSPWQGQQQPSVPPVYPAQPAGTAPGTASVAPTPPAPSAPPGTVVGPFATWGAPSAPPGVPPPVVRMPARPIIGEGTATFLRLLLISFVLAAAILGAVLLFVRSYEEHRQHGAVMAMRSRMAEAEQLIASGDLEGAASRYEQILVGAPQTEEGRVARTNLATVLNRLGLRAAQMGQADTAVSRFQAVLDLYSRYPEGMTQADLQEQQNAYENLQALALRVQSPMGTDSYGQSATPPPASADMGGAPALSEARAREYLEAGNQAYEAGDIASARDLWTRAVGVAPGTKAGMQAQRRLEQTMQVPDF